MKYLINRLIDAAIGDLTALRAEATPAGPLAHIVPVDDDLLMFLAGASGAFDLPLAGVLYGGDEVEESDTTGRALVTRQRVSVIVVTSNAVGVDGALTGSAGLYALVGEIRNALAGKSVNRQSRAGVLLASDGTDLPGGGTPILLADAWFYTGNEPFDVGSDAEARGLMGWAAHFECLVSEYPDRDDTAETEFEGADWSGDPRPGASPATPATDHNKFSLEFGDD